MGMDFIQGISPLPAYCSLNLAEVYRDFSLTLYLRNFECFAAILLKIQFF